MLTLGFEGVTAMKSLQKKNIARAVPTHSSIDDSPHNCSTDNSQLRSWPFCAQALPANLVKNVCLYAPEECTFFYAV